MAHEYLPLEEAAAFLGLTADEVKGLRESGDLRGFADKGNWKFRKDHLEEYQQSRAGAESDGPLFNESGPGASDLFRIGGGEADAPASDETGRQAIPGVDLTDDGDFDFGGTAEFAEPANTEPPKPKAPPTPRDDDGDFLVEEFEVPETEPSSNETAKRPLPDPLATADGTADLSEEAKAVKPGGGSTGKLERPDVDVDPGEPRTAEPAAEQQDDPGVNLVPGDTDAVPAELHEHDSGIILADTDSGLALGTSDVLSPESGVDLVSDSELLSGSDALDDVAAPVLAEEDSRVVVGAEAMSGTDFGDSDVSALASGESDVDLDETGDSGIALDVGDESGIALDTGDSGIALDFAGEESGIALDTGDSGIALDLDTGSALDAGDSGIALDTGDSGIALDFAGDESGIALDAGDSGIALDVGGDSGIALDAGDSGLALDLVDSGIDGGGAVDGTQRMHVTADDAPADFADFDEESESDESDATQKVPIGVVDSEFDLAEVGEEEFESGDAFDEIDDDVADELEEIDELDEFDEEEDEFAEVGAGLDEDPFEDDEFDEPVAKKAPSGPQWGAVPMVGLTMCTLVMLASAAMTWQSMRVMWTGAVAEADRTVFDKTVDQMTDLIP